jgi:hypothetical protein
MIKSIKADSTNVIASGNRRATKEEIADAMLLLTGTRKAPSEVEISIPAMDTALEIYKDGIRGLQVTEGGIVNTFALAFEKSFECKNWYDLEFKGKLGVGVRKYHKEVVTFLATLGNSKGYPDAQWLMIKKASGFKTEGMIKAEAANVAKEEAVKVEAQKSSDQKICDYLTSIINLINKADTTIKATPFLGQFQSAFYSIGGKMFK